MRSLRSATWTTLSSGPQRKSCNAVLNLSPPLALHVSFEGWNPLNIRTEQVDFFRPRFYPCHRHIRVLVGVVIFTAHRRLSLEALYLPPSRSINRTACRASLLYIAHHATHNNAVPTISWTILLYSLGAPKFDGALLRSE